MTATGMALDALAAALAHAAAQEDPALPVPKRNESAEDAAEALDGDPAIRAWLNLLDGRQTVADELLGNGEPSYEIEHRAVIEWVVLGHDRPTREATFHAGLTAIEAAIAADRTLSGAVADVRLAAPGDVTDGRLEGGAPFKSAEIPVDLLFVSDMPV